MTTDKCAFSLFFFFSTKEKENKKTNPPHCCPLNLSFSCPSICDDDATTMLAMAKKHLYIEDIFNYLPSM
jgi:hypothetical protein